MGKNRNKGGRSSRAPNFGAAAGDPKMTFTDIDDEPKFIELPDDYGEEKGRGKGCD